MLKSTRKFYEMALSIFIGNQIIKKLETITEANSIGSIREGLLKGTKSGTSVQWIDLAGMIAPDHAIQDLIQGIKQGSVKDLDGVISGLKDIHSSYDRYSWDWTINMLADKYDIDISNINSDQLIEIVSKWESDSLKLNKMILNDATKEYDINSKIGFGIDGDQTVIDQDFEAVRGVIEENKFIIGINKESKQIESKVTELKNRLGNL